VSGIAEQDDDFVVHEAASSSHSGSSSAASRAGASSRSNSKRSSVHRQGNGSGSKNSLDGIAGALGGENAADDSSYEPPVGSQQHAWMARDQDGEPDLDEDDNEFDDVEDADDVDDADVLMVPEDDIHDDEPALVDAYSKPDRAASKREMASLEGRSSKRNSDLVMAMMIGMETESEECTM
jgi:hypothetical protein